jgi:hypothetical protein
MHLPEMPEGGTGIYGVGYAGEGLFIKNDDHISCFNAAVK